ncbi:hypothetical protein JVT61DRAFT_12055 [Boletus reticuloceps]|uniref:Uncharacterized protein n=1 Tax=Boletus reticuloceps TaxID=495285 RepID=A0A8I2YEI1_9AGAM|nr:hypothetical protein JVT61DRAFT_12055 [Boletus reticuloceps]
MSGKANNQIYPCSSPMDSFMTLLKDVRECNTTPFLHHEDFPNVVYWMKAEYQKDYKNGKGFLHMISNENSGSTGFLEDLNGVIIDSATQQDIREYQRTLWSTLHKFHLAPTTWGHCVEPVQEYCFHSMQIQFLVFTYCEGYWKIDTFMSLYYSQRGDHAQCKGDAEDNDMVKQEGTVTPESLLEASRTKLSKHASSTSRFSGSSKKSKVKTMSVDIKDSSGDSEIETTSSSPLM